MSLDELRFQQERRQRLLNLTLTCVVVLALIALGACGPGDAEIADGIVVSGDPTADEQIAPVRIPPPERLVTTTSTTVAPTTTTHYHPPTTVPDVPVRTAAASSSPPTPAVVSPPGSGCGGWGDTIAAHFPAEQVSKACAVMACESQGNPSASSSTNDHGLFQLHAGSSGFPGGWQETFRDVTGAPFFDGVYDPNLNVQFAAWLWRQSGWSPWACA